MEHDVACPSCKAGLVVEVTQASGGIVGEFVRVVDFATQEEMQSALQNVGAAHEVRKASLDSLRESEEQIAKGRVAHRLASTAVTPQ